MKFHSENRPTGSKSISLQLCDSLNDRKFEASIFPGQKVYPNCYAKLSALGKQTKPISSCSTSSLEYMEMALNNDEVFLSPLHGLKKVNQATEY